MSLPITCYPSTTFSLNSFIFNFLEIFFYFYSFMPTDWLVVVMVINKACLYRDLLASFHLLKPPKALLKYLQNWIYLNPLSFWSWDVYRILNLFLIPSFEVYMKLLPPHFFPSINLKMSTWSFPNASLYSFFSLPLQNLLVSSLPAKERFQAFRSFLYW